MAKEKLTKIWVVYFDNELYEHDNNYLVDVEQITWFVNLKSAKNFIKAMLNEKSEIEPLGGESDLDFGDCDSYHIFINNRIIVGSITLVDFWGNDRTGEVNYGK